MKKLIYIIAVTLLLTAINLKANAQIYYHDVNIQSKKPPKGWKHPSGYSFYLKKLDGVFDHVLCTPNTQGIVYIFDSKDHSENKYKKLRASLTKKFGTPKNISQQLKEMLKKRYDKSSGLTAGKAKELTLWKIAPHFVVTLLNTNKQNSVIFANKYK